MEENRKRFIIIEHMEESLFEWSYYEYIQMLKYVKNSPNLYLVFTQVDCFYTSKEADNIKFFTKYLEDIKEHNMEKRVILIRDNMQGLYNADKTGFIIKSDLLIDSNSSEGQSGAAEI